MGRALSHHAVGKSAAESRRCPVCDRSGALTNSLGSTAGFLIVGRVGDGESGVSRKPSLQAVRPIRHPLPVLP